MMAFDPDQYLAASAGFDPDAYLGTKPAKIGREAFGDIFRAELAKESPLNQALVGFGSAAGNVIQGVKQIFGQGNQSDIEANKIMESNAPVSAFAGNVAATAIPFGLAGNSLRAAGAVGAGIGALNPVEGEQTFSNIVRGKAINTALGAATGVAGQAVANKAGGYIADKLQAIQRARGQNAPIDQTLRDALDAGLMAPPSSVNPTFLNTMKEGISGKIATAQVMSNRNAPIIDDLARRAVGLPKGAPLTSEAMQAIRGGAFDVGYKPVTGAGTISTDDVYRDALGKLVADYQGAARSFPGAVGDDVTGLVMGRQVGGSPDKRIFVDGMGQIVKDIDIPSQPKTRSFLHELKKSGGLNPSELADLGVDKVNKSAPGLLNKNGRTMDRVVEWMEQHGWVSPQDIAMAERDGVGGSHELARDMIRSALNKDPVIHPMDGDAVYNFNLAMRNLDDMGIKQVKIPGTEATTKGGINVADFDAGDAIKMSQILRDNANKAFRDGDTGLGKASKGAAKAIEDQIERHLAGQGKDGEKMLRNFRQARMLMAKAHTVEDAIVEGGGTINARKLAQRVQAGKPMTGELATIGNFANNFQRATQPATQVAGPGVSKLTHLASLMLGGGGGAAMGGPVGAVAGAAAMETLPYALRARMLSKAAQQAAIDSKYAPGASTRLASLLQYSPVAGTVLGLETLGQ